MTFKFAEHLFLDILGKEKIGVLPIFFWSIGGTLAKKDWEPLP